MPANHVPIRRLTQGPDYCWFGYYDKLQFSADDRYVLGMRVGFEGRSPVASDVISLGMIDLQDGDRWLDLGVSSAWCWQQGCMLQWRPGTEDEVVWNERGRDGYVCRVLNVRTGASRTLPMPIYALSPDGRTAITPDFRRINDTRPGYGYAGFPDPFHDALAPEGSGIWRMDMETGESELVVSLAQVAAIPYPHADLSGRKHWFNHLLFNTDGTRFEFLHRWQDGRSFGTRMLTAALDGSDIHVVDDYGHTSHFIWRDPRHILAWARHPSHGDRFYLYEDVPNGCAAAEVVGPDAMTQNGHCTYLPGARWILNDTYPTSGQRSQRLYLYHVPTGRVHALAELPAPPEYTGEWRCDLHPRSSRRGTLVTVDSAHEGGRAIYLLDISEPLASDPLPTAG